MRSAPVNTAAAAGGKGIGLGGDRHCSDRNLSFNLPAVLPELVCSFCRFGRIHINEEEIIPFVAVNPGQSDHGGGSRASLYRSNV